MGKLITLIAILSICSSVQGQKAEAPFRYVMKRSGIREIEPKQSWSLTYSRTLLGSQETFKIDCMLIRDTCRVLLDEKSKTLIFRQ